MNYKLVIFDLDGTLVDTIADLGAATNAALAAKGLPQHEPEAFRGMVGHGVRNLVKQAMPEPMREDEQAVDALLKIFLAYYIDHLDDRSRPYPGMAELLAALQAAGVKLAVASNKFQVSHDTDVAHILERDGAVGRLMEIFLVSTHKTSFTKAKTVPSENHQRKWAKALLA